MVNPSTPPGIVWAMAIVFVVLELVFQAADAGVIAPVDLRWIAYSYLAFWDVMFEAQRDGQAVPAVLWTSFVTHALVHGNLLHLLMNGTIFLALGGMLANALGPFRFVMLFVVSAIGGALTFGLMADTQGPLVGASGAIFGFIGALKRWEWRYLRRVGAPADRFWRTIIGLAVLNVALLVFMPGGGMLAWQAHLGGFVAGFLIAPALAPGAAARSPI